jgi:hypothetical protein
MQTMCDDSLSLPRPPLPFAMSEQFVGCRGRHHHTYKVEWAFNRVASVVRATNRNRPDLPTVRSLTLKGGPSYAHLNGANVPLRMPFRGISPLPAAISVLLPST